jgi:hypothetical protein
MSDAVDQAYKHHPEHLERQRTAGGHVNDRSQPGLPIIHRTLASPAPLGLLSFATGELYWNGPLDEKKVLFRR